jgi:hypothetical protein
LKKNFSPFFGASNAMKIIEMGLKISKVWLIEVKRVNVRFKPKIR